MGRPVGSKNIKTLEFVRKYDRLLEQYGDPVEVLFILANRKRGVEVGDRIRAAGMLLPYRYPKLTSENVAQEQGELTLVWSDGKAVDNAG